MIGIRVFRDIVEAWFKQRTKIVYGGREHLNKTSVIGVWPPRLERKILGNRIDQCTACGVCVDICPVKAIALICQPKKNDFPVWVENFFIDHNKCVMCGICVSSCPEASLFIKDLNLQLAPTREDLIYNYGRGLRK